MVLWAGREFLKSYNGVLRPEGDILDNYNAYNGVPRAETVFFRELQWGAEGWVRNCRELHRVLKAGRVFVENYNGVLRAGCDVFDNYEGVQRVEAIS